MKVLQDTLVFTSQLFDLLWNGGKFPKFYICQSLLIVTVGR